MCCSMLHVNFLALFFSDEGNCSDSAASEAIRAAMDSLKIAEAHRKKGGAYIHTHTCSGYKLHSRTLGTYIN